MGTDLDKIIDDIYWSGNADGFSGYGQDTRTIEEYKQQILDWHNKQVEAVLDSLKKQTTNTFIAPTHGVPIEAIEAERERLKESGNE